MKCQNISDSLSRKLATAGFVGACLIPLLHTPVKVSAETLDGDYVAIARFVASAAVPLFCMISGFLMAGHVGEPRWYRHTVLSRVRTLLIPFFFWCLAAFVFRLLATVLFKCDNVNLSDFGIRRIVLILGLHPLDWPEHGYMWYVRFLFLFALVSPILLLMKKKKAGAIFLVGSFVCWTLFSAASLSESNNVNIRRLDFLLDWFFPIRGCVAVLVGAYLRYYPVDVKYKKTWGIVAVVASIVFHELTTDIGMTQPLVKCMLVAGLWLMLDGVVVPSRLAELSFPIFVLHWFAIVGLKYTGFFECLPQTIVGFFVGYLSIVLLTVFVAVAYLSVFPRVAAISFGGRSRKRK